MQCKTSLQSKVKAKAMSPNVKYFLVGANGSEASSHNVGEAIAEQFPKSQAILFVGFVTKMMNMAEKQLRRCKG